MSTYEPNIIEHPSSVVRGSKNILPLVLIHGWGQSSDCWELLLPRLTPLTTVFTVDLPGCGGCGTNNKNEFSGLSLEQFIDGLVSRLPEKFIIGGWSLGGEIATLIAARFPERVKGVLTLASSPQFVSVNTELGMLPKVFDDFYQGFQQGAAQTLKRFSGLIAQGDKEQRDITRTLRASLKREFSEYEISVGAQLLEWLKDIELWSTYKLIQCPALYLFAENDALIPVGAAKKLDDFVVANQLGKSKVKIISDRGHGLPFAYESGALIESWLESTLLNGHTLNKKIVAESFSAAADSYDSAADLQRRIVDKLQNTLTSYLAEQKEACDDSSPLSILDLGTGTGYGLTGLSNRFPNAQCYALDIAEGMLRHARNVHGNQCQYLAGDAENLPLADNSVDLIFSSLSIQWCQHPFVLFSEIKRVLKPGGRFVFATLGPESLCELKQAWSKVDSAVHVNRFLPAGVLLSAAEKLAFNINFQENYMDVELFPQPMALFKNLKHLGAHNVNAGRPKGLTGRGRIKALCDAYEEHRLSCGSVPASWEVITGIFQKASANRP